MSHLHYEIDAGPEQVVEVTLDKQANVLLLDAENYEKYKSNQTYQYFGGLATSSPCRLRPPSQGHWHIAVDLGGQPGEVNVSVVVRQ